MRQPFWKRETIYRGMNGRTVERVYLNPEESLIRKPCGPDSQEIWIYQHVLRLFPPIYPQIVEFEASSAGSEEGWALFEDLGPLRHEYRLEWAEQVVRLTAWWHALPPESIQGASSLKGLKPGFPQMLQELLAPGNNRRELAFLARAERANLSDELVFTHGDLHVGNYAFARGQIYILDWEHAHLNSRYWDLYHLIDLSHPLYPRTTITASWRTRLLHAYLEQSARLGVRLDSAAFFSEYGLFASVFSLWMLSLMEKDKLGAGGPWSYEQLERQSMETAVSLTETMAYFHNKNG
jgi:thiamine kinase-like enzyme